MATTITANGINFPDGSAAAPSIGGTDTNTGLFTGSDIVGFATGGVERIKIDAQGDIFIGTTSDIAPANGTNLCVSDGTISRLILEKQSTIKFGLNVSTGFTIYDETNDAARFSITSTGVIQTGTAIGASGADGNQRLVVGRDGDCNIAVRATGSTTASTGIDFGDSGDDRSGRIQYMHNGNYMSFHTNGAGSGSSNERLRITSAGNVGIGTTSPGHILDLYNSNGTDCLRLNVNTGVGGSNKQNAIRFSVDGTVKGHVGLAVDAGKLISGSSANDFCVKTNDENNIIFATNSSEKLRITSAGHVGIGVNDPAVAGGYHGMEIGGSANTGLRLSCTASSGWAFTDYEASGTQKFMAGMKGSSDPDVCSWRIAVGASLDSNVRFAVTENGKVGIGTTTPSSNLHLKSGSSGATANSYSVLTIESSSGTANVLQFLSPNTASQSIRFGDPQDDGNGFIQYSHATASMLFGAYGPTKFRIESNGNVKIDDGDLVIGTSGHGIDFSATSHASGMSSELLDSYEEGTWTPSLSFGGGSTGMSINKQTGYYVKIGRLVNVGGTLILSAKGSSTGAAALGGLPFSIGNHDASTSAEGGGFFTYWINMNSDKLDWTLRGSNNSSTADISVSRSGGHTQIDGATQGDFQNTSSIRFVMTYQT